jgi:hypothetical protein
MLSESDLADLKADAIELASPYLEDGRLPTARGVNFVTARKPA